MIWSVYTDHTHKLIRNIFLFYSSYTMIIPLNTAITRLPPRIRSDPSYTFLQFMIDHYLSFSILSYTSIRWSVHTCTSSITSSDQAYPHHTPHHTYDSYTHTYIIRRPYHTTLPIRSLLWYLLNISYLFTTTRYSLFTSRYTCNTTTLCCWTTILCEARDRLL